MIQPVEPAGRLGDAAPRRSGARHDAAPRAHRCRCWRHRRHRRRRLGARAEAWPPMRCARLGRRRAGDGAAPRRQSATGRADDLRAAPAARPRAPARPRRSGCGRRPVRRSTSGGSCWPTSAPGCWPRSARDLARAWRGPGRSWLGCRELRRPLARWRPRPPARMASTRAVDRARCGAGRVARRPTATPVWPAPRGRRLTAPRERPVDADRRCRVDAGRGPTQSQRC